MQKKFYLIYLLLCFPSVVVLGQDCNLKLQGTITDSRDGTPIEGASIKIEGSDLYAVSDLRGVFILEKICSAKFKATISHISCDSKVVLVDLNKESFLDIKLELRVERLNEVTVYAQSDKKTKTAQESILKKDILEQYSSLSLGDAIKEISGVSSINTGNSIVKPIINGMHGSRVLVMVNQVRLQDQEWGVEHSPSVDVNSAEQISVIKGSGALAFGSDAIGGVIVMNPPRVILKDTLYGKTIIGSHSNGRGYSGSTWLSKNYSSGWFTQVQGSFKRNGDFYTPDYNLTNTGFDSKTVTLRLGRKRFESGFEIYSSFLDNEIGILASSHIGSAFNLLQAINSGQPVLVKDFSYRINVPKQKTRHSLVKATYFKRYKKFGKVNFQYDYQHNKRFEFDVRIGDRKNVPAIDLTLQTHSFMADLTLDSDSSEKVRFGILGRYQDNFANPDTGVRRLIPDYNKYDYGLYGSVEWQLGENSIADAGIRYDYNKIDAKKFYRKSRWAERGYDQDFSNLIVKEFATQLLTNPVFSYHNISASLGMTYHLNDQSYLMGNYALASRPPNPSELFSDGLHHSAARFELGDLRFNQEISSRISTSYQYNSSKLSLLAEVFYNTINDFMYLRPFDFLVTTRGPFPIWAYEQTNAELMGFDLTTVHKITHAWQLENRSAFIKGYNKKTHQPLINMPPFNTVNQITYTHKKWNNFSAKLKSEWMFQQNEYPNFNFEIEDLLTGELFDVDVSSPPPAYHLLHFQSQATFHLNKATKLNVSLGINNLLNVRYRNYLNRLRYYSDDLGRNVTLQLKFNY